MLNNFTSKQIDLRELNYHLNNAVRIFETPVGNPFLSSSSFLEFILSLNNSGINWLIGQCNNDKIRDLILNMIIDTIVKQKANGLPIIELLDRISRYDKYPTSWLNTEKQLFRNRILDCFLQILYSDVDEYCKDKVLKVLFETVVSSDPKITVDTRGQCIDIIIEFVESFKEFSIAKYLNNINPILLNFVPNIERERAFQLTENHDTIDPYTNIPNINALNILWEASIQKAKERAFVFGSRLFNMLLGRNTALEPLIIQTINEINPAQSELVRTQKDVLKSPIFEQFILDRLPSFSSQLQDYVVNRHQVLIHNLTIHELCRLLISCPENSSSSIQARITINAFFRQVFGTGNVCNIGIDARPFFIDHGFGPKGERLDWCSYVFIPAGAIWGKGAGVDLSCGVAFGGGSNLSKKIGRDGAYIGGSWSSTLYHGHSHIGGERGSKGAESRDKIVHFGLTVDDGKKLPWGEYIEAENHQKGNIFDGVKTYLLAPF